MRELAIAVTVDLLSQSLDTVFFRLVDLEALCVLLLNEAINIEAIVEFTWILDDLLTMGVDFVVAPVQCCLFVPFVIFLCFGFFKFSGTVHYTSIFILLTKQKWMSASQSGQAAVQYDKRQSSKSNHSPPMMSRFQQEEVRQKVTRYLREEGKLIKFPVSYSTIQLIQTLLIDAKNYKQLAFDKNPNLELHERQWKKELNQLNKKLLSTEKKIKELEQIVKKEIENHNQTKKNSQLALEQFRKNKSTISAFDNSRDNRFLGEILHEEEDYKEYVIKILEKVLKREVIRGRLLYRMDLVNPTNFHKYIDHHLNILLVVKLKNGFMLAVFHEDAISDKMSSRNLGLIFSLTNRCCFKNIKAAVLYDPYHLIYGNSEIKIMKGGKTIFSNFGINNGYYERNGQTVDILMGEGKKRQLQMETYEILQILFK